MRLPRPIRVFAKRLAYGGGASALERERVVDWLALAPGMVIADIGAGFGAWAYAFADAVGPTGRVYAVDTDDDLRSEVAMGAARRGLTQVRTVEATPDAPGLPEPVDLVFLSASFHHLPDQVGWLRGLGDGLRPGARVVIVESRPGAGLRVPGHDTDPAEVRATMAQAGYALLAGADLIAGCSLQAFVASGQHR
jgi:ubiquinone/menaquinone biosynthesis C-methylase UbiE